MGWYLAEGLAEGLANVREPVARNRRVRDDALYKSTLTLQQEANCSRCTKLFVLNVTSHSLQPSWSIVAHVYVPSMDQLSIDYQLLVVDRQW